LDDRVADTITEWKTDPRKSQIIIRQLLNQTDGIEAAPFLHRESIRDRNAVAVRLPSLAAPGARFIYGPSHFQILAELLRRLLSERSLLCYFEQNRRPAWFERTSKDAAAFLSRGAVLN
jgi:CubicO group peptidase (beta-lactamase class C family)